MSYCRLSESDVYAYACEGGVQFWVTGKTLDRLCETYDSAYQYAKYLRDECGLDVPSHAIEALRADALEEANHGDGSVVAELVSENAKLRELLRNALTYIEYEGCGVECPETGHGATLTSCDICNRYETDSCAYVIAQSARELGIEESDD